ncbi:MAG: TonB-dependent receptor, partial [Novosphingobium sp.]|nr:TonB-dependent receptor [Novosphingobium sp.]
LSILAELTPTLENYTIFKWARSENNGATGKIAYCDPTSTAPLAAVPAVLSPYVPLVQTHCDQLAFEQANDFGYYDVQNSQPNVALRQRTWQVINTTTWEVSDNLTIKNIISYGEAKESYAFNIEGDNVSFPFVMTNPGPNKGQGNQWTFTEEFQLQGRAASERLQWQVGFYTEHSRPLGGEGSQEQLTQFLSPCSDLYAFKCSPIFTFVPALGRIVTVGNLGFARNVYYYRNYGLYAQATYELTDKLSFTAGIRNTWDWQKEDADNVVITPARDGSGPESFRCSRGTTPANPDIRLVQGLFCTRSFVEKSSEPTWLIGLDFKPTEDILLFAKYARGYRGGGINEANQFAETWNPEFVDDYEIGLKASFRGAVSGYFNITGFWNEFRDQQASVFIPQCNGTTDPECTMPAFTGINGIQNVGKSRIRGIEADAMVNVTRDLRLEVGYAYLDAEVTGGSTPFCNNAAFDCERASFLTPGSRLPFSPKNRITATATYFLPVDESVGRISVGATFTHTDKYYASHANDAAFAAGKIPFNASIAPATDLLNLSMNWKSVAGSPVDLAFFATNVTNEKYYVAPAGGIATFGAEYLFLGEPRMYGVRVKFNFGE